MQRTDSLKKTLMLGRIEGEGDDRGWDGWMASPKRWTWVWASSKSGDGQGSLACCSPWGRKESDTTGQLNWTEAMLMESRINIINYTNDLQGNINDYFPSLFIVNAILFESKCSSIRNIDPLKYIRKTSWPFLSQFFQLWNDYLHQTCLYMRSGILILP